MTPEERKESAREVVKALGKAKSKMNGAAKRLLEFGEAVGDDDLQRHAKEMYGAANIAQDWIDGLKQEEGI